jgi:hypothetical protein
MIRSRARADRRAPGEVVKNVEAGGCGEGEDDLRGVTTAAGRSGRSESSVLFACAFLFPGLVVAAHSFLLSSSTVAAHAVGARGRAGAVVAPKRCGAVEKKSTATIPSSATGPRARGRTGRQAARGQAHRGPTTPWRWRSGRRRMVWLRVAGSESEPSSCDASGGGSGAPDPGHGVWGFSPLAFSGWCSSEQPGQARPAARRIDASPLARSLAGICCLPLPLPARINRTRW